MTSLYCPPGNENDPEYVCAYCQKTCTTKASLKLHLKATQYHSYDAVGEDEPEAENVDEVQDTPVIPDGPCLIPCVEVFLMDTLQTTTSD